jgi:hypothetical protein
VSSRVRREPGGGDAVSGMGGLLAALRECRPIALEALPVAADCNEAAT